MTMPAENERIARVLVMVLGAVLAISVVVPFVVVSIRESSVTEGFAWFLGESGVVAGLMGCLLVAVVVRGRRRKEWHDG